MHSSVVLVVLCSVGLVLCPTFASETGPDKKTARPSWQTTPKNGGWISSGLKGPLLDTIFASYGRSNISGSCKDGFAAYSTGFESGETWAVKMADASSKAPAGILRGTSVAFGSFEACTRQRAEVVQGRFCMVGLGLAPISSTRHGEGPYVTKFGRPPEWIRHYLANKGDLGEGWSLWLGMCLPSTCSEEDIRGLFQNVVAPPGVTVDLKDCREEEPEPVPFSSKVAIWALLSLVSMCVVGTFVDVFRKPSTSENDSPKEDGFLLRTLVTFSVRASHRRLQREASKSTTVGLFYGIRMMTCTSVILGHVYIYPNFWQRLRFSGYMRTDELMAGFERPFFENASIFVDNFFFMSGFLLLYTLWRPLGRNGGKINLVRFFLHRYLRIMPSFLLLVALGHVLPLFSRGPIWNSFMEDFTRPCRAGILNNLLLIQNFLPINQQCWPHGWWLSVLMQCHVIGVILLLALFRSRRFGVMLGILTLGACSAYLYNKTLADHRRLPCLTRTNDALELEKFAEDIYFRPFLHVGCYAAGMVSGYLTVNYSNRTFSKMQRVLYWVLSGAVLATAFFSLHAFPLDGPLTAVYIFLHRPLWCAGLIWVAYACANGMGGWLEDVLSWRPLVTLSNLSYNSYILHPLLYVFKAASSKERIFMFHYEFIFDFVSICVQSFFLSYVAYLMVESPCQVLKNRYLGSEVDRTEVKKSSTKCEPAVPESHQTGTDAVTDSHQTSTDAGTDSHKTSTDAGTDSHKTSTDAETESHQAGTDAGTDSHQTGTDAVTDSHQTGTDAGTDSHHTGTDAATDSHQTGTDAGTDSHQTGTDAETESHQAGTDAGTDSHQTDTDAVTKSHQAGTDAVAESHQTGTDAGTDNDDQQRI